MGFVTLSRGHDEMASYGINFSMLGTEAMAHQKDASFQSPFADRVGALEGRRIHCMCVSHKLQNPNQLLCPVAVRYRIPTKKIIGRTKMVFYNYYVPCRTCAKDIMAANGK